MVSENRPALTGLRVFEESLVNVTSANTAYM